MNRIYLCKNLYFKLTHGIIDDYLIHCLGLKEFYYIRQNGINMTKFDFNDNLKINNKLNHIILKSENIYSLEKRSSVKITNIINSTPTLIYKDYTFGLESLLSRGFHKGHNYNWEIGIFEYDFKNKHSISLFQIQPNYPTIIKYIGVQFNKN